MSTQFYCSFSAEQARQHGIPRGVIEIHADSMQDAREIATKWFPATKDLPFGERSAITGEIIPTEMEIAS